MEEKKKVGGKTAAVGVGAGLGAWAGAGVGIAGAFGAVSGLLPLALLGGYLGHKIHKAVTSGSAEKFTTDFKRGYAKSYEETADQHRRARARVAEHRKRLAEQKKP